MSVLGGQRHRRAASPGVATTLNAAILYVSSYLNFNEAFTGWHNTFTKLLGFISQTNMNIITIYMHQLSICVVFSFLNIEKYQFNSDGENHSCSPILQQPL